MATTDHMTLPAVHAPGHQRGPGRVLQALSLALPVIKCLACPACLSVIGGVFAGARFGFHISEQTHLSVLVVALAVDVGILSAAARHHESRRPLQLCLLGGALAFAGHFTHVAVEYLGFALLIAGATYNIVLMRQHRAHGGTCCAHG